MTRMVIEEPEYKATFTCDPNGGRSGPREPIWSYHASPSHRHGSPSIAAATPDAMARTTSTVGIIATGLPEPRFGRGMPSSCLQPTGQNGTGRHPKIR